MDLSEIPDPTRPLPGMARGLPAFRHLNEACPPAAGVRPIRRQVGATVCVFDGAFGARHRLAALLRQACVGEVICFTDPLAALEWCLAERPPLVLVGEALAGLGGAEFAAKVRVAVPGGGAVVALLGPGCSAEARVQARAAGVADVIATELPDQEVIGRLRAVAELAHARLLGGEGLLAQAWALEDRQVCTESGEVLPTLRRCALAYGLRPPQCDVLEDAWTCLVAARAPTRLRAVPSAAARRAALHALASAERARAAWQCGTDPAEAGAWAAQMLLHGNEHWDGSGGPLGLRGADIPVPARLFHLVNSHALLRARAAAGGAGLTHERAMGLLQAWSGAEFDPEMMACLAQTA